MLRQLLIIAALATLLARPAVTYAASPAPAPTGTSVTDASEAASPSPGTPVCTITDHRAVELSGLVATDDGYVAINDSNEVAAAIRIFFFDPACRLTRTIGYPTTARDPEDVAAAADGTLWVADIGDNLTNAANNRRATIAIWQLTPGSSTPVVHRLTYPDGPHDAETLIINGDGTLVIVTKELAGPAGVYVPVGPLQPNTPTGVALRKVGEFTPVHTATPGFLGTIGQNMITGGANAPDRTRVALRTYSDAYEFDVPDGDVVKAITTGTPRVTALPNEPQGESIAYTHDGTAFLTVSDQSGPTTLLKYQPTKPVPPTHTATAPASTRPAAANATAARPTTLNEIFRLLATIGFLGIVLILVGLWTLRRSRNTRRKPALSQPGPPPAVILEPPVS